MIDRLVQPGDTVWDIGAHHGVTAITAARRVGNAGVVHAFEPSSRNFDFLTRHVQWNRMTNIVLHSSALAAMPGDRDFGGKGSSQTLSLDQGSEVVRCTSIGALLDNGIPPPTVVKLDTEGSEGEILEAGISNLPSNCRLLISVHSQENYKQVIRALSKANFVFLESQELIALAESGTKQWSRDPDLLAFGPQAIDPFCGFRNLPMFQQ